MRSDANTISIHLISQLVQAAHDFECELEGTKVEVVSTLMQPPPWPQAAGTPPPFVSLACKWPKGSVDLLFGADRLLPSGSVALKIVLAETGAQILWLTLPKIIADHADGEELEFWAQTMPFKRKGDGNIEEMSEAMRQAFARSGLPSWKNSQWRRVLAFNAKLPAKMMPDPGVVFERLVKIALLKLPGFARAPGLVQGQQLYVVPQPSPAPFVAGTSGSDEEEKFAGAMSLPGGVRDQKATIDAVLERVGDGCSRTELVEFFRTRYEITGKASPQSYLGVFKKLGLLDLKGDQVELGKNAETYLPDRRSVTLFELFDDAYSGFFEMLVVADDLGGFGNKESVTLFKELLEVDWQSPHQVDYRRNWLLSLGIFDRKDGDDTLTELGLEILKERPTARAEVRDRLDDLQIDAKMSQLTPEEDAELTAVVEAERAAGWDTELQLTAEAIKNQTDLKLSPELLTRAAVALCSGKHLLLIGPPGTGKTKLAEALGEAAKSEGYCLGMHTATASADWTTFDTVGGYSLQKDGSLRFRSGALLRAVEQKKWLLVDELNRADVDRAFGELMTVLSGGSTDTSYETQEGKQIRIGPDKSATHYVPPSFRVIATMNTWDKTSLFRLSFAVQRRFAIIYVGCPSPTAYSELLTSEATSAGPGQPLLEARAAQIVTLFSHSGLLAQREIGPAIARDIVRYTRRREKAGDGLAEALSMFLLPQLEGLRGKEVSLAWKAMSAALDGWTQPSVLGELRDRFRDLFPDSGVE